MRTEGADFLQKNAALSEEVRRTLVDLDEVEKELKKATKAIDAAAGLTGKYDFDCDRSVTLPSHRRRCPKASRTKASLKRVTDSCRKGDHPCHLNSDSV
jgi:hypothetical protein